MTKTPIDTNKYSEDELLRLLDAMHHLCETENWCYETEQTYLQIVALIKKPEVTEEWLEEKAIELNNEILLGAWRKDYYIVCKDFIRSLVEEIVGE